ncbi:hypothetical protein LCGC14_0641400 [marine sediment metagenome]|uniref:Uncharacterized protein n=1 Tax=marine sediment metagenome TaxID=412755 RepID=A0A0F9QZ09_9ZZZZ|nr:hypothetical protein [archaeon]HEC36779.1 hypothetical protein [bacterium]
MKKPRTKIEERQFCDQGCPCEKCHIGNPDIKLCDFCVFELWKKRMTDTRIMKRHKKERKELNKRQTKELAAFLNKRVAQA